MKFDHVFTGFRVITVALVAFVIGGVALVWGFLTQPKVALYAYLSAYSWVLSITLGALLFLMIVHAMGATWPVAIRRVVEVIVGILPLAAVGFIPIAMGLKSIYPWAVPIAAHEPALQHIITHQRPYLNSSSFLVRAAIYFALWVGIGAALRLWSFRQDSVPDAQYQVRSRILSAVGIFPVALALTFASFDWLMSLTPTWYSTMFGVYLFSGGFLAAISLVVLLVATLQRAGMLERVGRSHYYALGRLMLTFTIFWAYVAYFQLFLMWIADKPNEVLFYTLRSTKQWFPFSVVLAVVHFVMPFFWLLSYRVKQSPKTLAPIAA